MRYRTDPGVACWETDTLLHEFLTTNTTEIISRARAKLALRTDPAPTEAEMKNGVPLFLEQLIDRLRFATTDSDAIEASAAHHGGELLDMGFSISQVVHGYGDVCQAITELAEEVDAPIRVEEFQMFNKCQDDATAEAVTEYERQRDQSVAKKGLERRAILAHEMANRVAAALISFNLLQKGAVGIGGSTSAVLGRSLRALRMLVNNSLAEVRIEAGHGMKERISVSELIAEVRGEASMVAEANGSEFLVSPVEAGVRVEADPQIPSAALSNLIQNAFKFSRPGARISLRTVATVDRVIFEVEDECGGLPRGAPLGLFSPAEPSHDNRPGLGMGLTISARGVEGAGGRVGARDIPGKGCVFWIDLPRPLPN